MKMRSVSAACVLAACAGSVFGQITVDGQLTAAEASSYGALKFVQTVPTGFGDNIAVTGCNNSSVGNPAAVTTGVEISIPLADIGSPTGAIRVMAFINDGGHGFVSNQVLPSLPTGFGNLGEPRALDFTTITGNQFATAGTGASSPVIDGTLDAGVYGSALAVQGNRTGFEDDTDAAIDTATGSELDVLYATVANGALNIFIGGNMKSDFTKLELFIDAGEGGVSQLASGATYADVDFGALQRLQGGAEGPGLTFDAGFTPEYYMTFGCGGAPVTHYPNLTVIEGGANPGYLGSATTGSGSGVLSGGNNPNGIQVALNNANIDGVPAICPPAQGNRDNATGSEIDGLYTALDLANGNLYVLITGNLQSNYNKLDLFFDVNGATEGVNVMLNTNPDIDFNGLNAMAGLTFDAGFTADYWMALGNGNQGTQMFANASVLRANGAARNFVGNPLDYGAYNGGTKSAGNDPINFDGVRADIQDGFTANIFCETAPRTCGLPYLSGGSAPNPTPDLIQITLDNRNTAGVTGTVASSSAAAAVTTGVEMRLSLSELGWDGTSDIKITGFINAGNHSFLSNQVIGGLPVGTTNLGSPASVNFANIDGDQFVTVSAGAPACSWQTDNCFADYTNDGGIDGDDVIGFFADWDSANVCADVDGSGGVDGDDVISFFSAWDNAGAGFPGC